MTISEWPEHDRPREKLLNLGAEKLTDSELLAILIQTGTTKLSSVDCARALLTEYTNLRSIIELTAAEIYKQPGIGPAKFAMIQAAAELGRRALHQNKPAKGCITSSEQAQRYFKYALQHKKVECVGFLYLNPSHEIIMYDEPFAGGATQVHLHYRECIQKALNVGCTSILMAHNHPNGFAKPSQADIDTTEQLRKALDYVDIALVDHIIVGKNDTFSMRKEGLLRS